MAVSVTRLRYAKSKDATKLIRFVNSLPFKIEIKGNPVLQKGSWVLFFIPPDEESNPVIDKFLTASLGGIDLDKM